MEGRAGQECLISSTTNVKLKSGYEVFLGGEGKKLENVFQFNFNHRISIFSGPVGHPRTGLWFTHSLSKYKLLTKAAIIIFYPTLPIHINGSKKTSVTSLNRNENGHNFSVDQQTCECGFHNKNPLNPVSVRSNAIPAPDEWKMIQGDVELRGWESQKRKQFYATAYDMILKLQLKERLEERKKSGQTSPQR